MIGNLQVGGVAYCASGIYAAEWRLRYSHPNWDWEDSWIIQVCEYTQINSLVILTMQ